MNCEYLNGSIIFFNKIFILILCFLVSIVLENFFNKNDNIN